MKQIYALNIGLDRWVILRADVPCNAGEGERLSVVKGCDQAQQALAEYTNQEAV